MFLSDFNEVMGRKNPAQGYVSRGTSDSQPPLQKHMHGLMDTHAYSHTYSHEHTHLYTQIQKHTHTLIHITHKPNKTSQDKQTKTKN